jgi:hypothetical protein
MGENCKLQAHPSPPGLRRNKKFQKISKSQASDADIEDDPSSSDFEATRNEEERSKPTTLTTLTTPTTLTTL